MRHRIVAFLAILWATSMTVEAVTHRALVFGLGKQEDTSWGKIHGDNDIHYVVEMLHTMGYTDIATLRNEQATKVAMVRAFRELAARCRRGDYVYIHYSGHGQLMTDVDGDESQRWTGRRHAQWDEAWIPYDAYMTYCDKDRGEKHLSDDEVALLLQSVRRKIGRSGQLTVVVDACHSGDATSAPGDDESECVRGVDMKFSIPKTVGSDVAQPTEEQWRTISACQPYQLCTEIRHLQVGKLTYALYSMGADVLKKGNADIERRLHQFMEQHKGRLPQSPMVRGKK